ncbi:hypothetical protein BFP76_11620 [Amylibacter kogurei]|uniref:Parvulin-like PPIase n=1 Tax=Paramylibacter kogurei TaxID=1889778 RepID=A0A2G5KBW6_9RHOB|nr:peptidylprolyl isomerase [Amylibacter kogurei]PIB26542.1 hypothetical protein BFP76_11620 [Amylibacter kogurei]
MNFIQKTAATFGVIAGMAAPSFAEDINGDTVLATVNGTKITAAHVVTLVDRLPPNYAALDDKVLFDGILDQLIQQTLLADTANTDSKRVKLARENEERALLATVALDALGDTAITEEALAKEYEAEFGDLPEEPEFKAAHILVETEETAKELIAALEGGAEFGELAKEKSTGPSGPNGGDLGWFGQGQMVPEFEEAVAAMEVGGVSAPVKTQFGWHVIKLNEKRNKPAPTMEEVKESLEDSLRGKAVEAEITRLEAEGEIDKLEVSDDYSFIRNTTFLDD